MKKRLSFLGAITLLGTSTTSLVACNNIPQYNEDELQQLKQENQICTNCQEIKEKLEWIAPQEKPFNTVDNKYYFVVWCGNENDVWEIVKFKNYEEIVPPKHEYQYKTIDEKNKYKIQLRYYSRNDTKINLIIFKSINEPTFIWEKNSNNFKAVYRWNGSEQNLPNLVIDNDGNIKVNGE
ncbi:lipoprotein [Spiroplasma citri]|uniref:lipoprotein n=1 Tax=Spiroplasma citri TaxID=2133 RepID=UPI0011BB3123|nr:lipoprotein [Spiroplasma citri]QED24577.1 hypothetical protein FRX96_03825 [Spiroplasma citri]